MAFLQASSSTSRILDNQTVGELKAEIVSLKGLLLSRYKKKKQFHIVFTLLLTIKIVILVKYYSAASFPFLLKTTCAEI